MQREISSVPAEHSEKNGAEYGDTPASANSK
jgi:hypothetical protein